MTATRSSTATESSARSRGCFLRNWLNAYGHAYGTFGIALAILAGIGILATFWYGSEQSWASTGNGSPAPTTAARSNELPMGKIAIRMSASERVQRAWEVGSPQ